MSDATLAALSAALDGTHVIERELEGGGMSRVFVARERALGRHVVIKVLDDAGRTVDAARFRHEILLSAALQHPHIVPVHTAGEAAGTPYFIMPFVEGISLRARLRDGALAIGEATRVLRDVASALLHAHARGIVHRDLKPENVMLSGGSAVVLDFGVAKAVALGQTGAGDASSTLTGAGFAVGTPRYMAPEQAAGDPALDYRADIYAFGVLAYELFTGRPPFEGPPADVLRKHITELPPDVVAGRPELPATLVALVRACLEKSPQSRPQDATVLLDALDGLSTPLSGTHAVPVRQRHNAPPGSRWFEAAAVPGSYLLVAGAALAWLFHLSAAERIREGVLAAAIIGSLLGFPLSIAGGLLLRIVSRDRTA